MKRAKGNSGKSNGLAGGAPAQDVRRLFSFQLQRLAALSSRIAFLTITPKYKLTLREWRALAVLDYLDKAPLQVLANHSGLLKSQMSRVVSGLIARKLVARSDNPEDGRSVILQLTGDGRDVVSNILSESEYRNEEMLSELSAQQRQTLDDAMQAVFRSSLAHYEKLRREVASSGKLDLGDDADMQS